MRSAIITVFALIFLQSCVRQNTPTQDLMEIAPLNSTLLFSGDFEKGPYGNSVGGKAQIFQTKDEFTLVFDKDFIASNGPDLYVYLSKEKQPSNFISLGKLKSTNGGQVYTLQKSINFDEYKYAVVHCQQYNHLFNYALIQKK